MCPECYSRDDRITPLLNPEACLREHQQYVCGTCGRCICIQKDSQRQMQRWMFPFSSCEKALLYLRTADYSNQKSCGIYELINDKGRRSYKIFSDSAALSAYLHRNPQKKSMQKEPIVKKEPFSLFPNTEIKMLSEKEIALYLLEQGKTRK